jgi:hypothetical protein
MIVIQSPTPKTGCSSTDTSPPDRRQPRRQRRRERRPQQRRHNNDSFPHHDDPTFTNDTAYHGASNHDGAEIRLHNLHPDFSQLYFADRMYGRGRRPFRSLGRCPARQICLADEDGCPSQCR